MERLIFSKKRKKGSAFFMQSCTDHPARRAKEMKGCRDSDEKVLSVADTLPEMPCIDQIAIRNARIRKRYEELRSGGMKSRAIECLLGEEFFLAPESIHRVFYGKREK